MWLSVRQKILVTFGIIVLLMLALGLYQLQVLRSVRDLSEQIVVQDLSFLNDVHEIALVQQQARAARDRLRDVTLLAALGNGSANRQAALAEWQNEFTKLRQAVGALRASLQGRLDDIESAGVDQQIRQLIYTLAAAEDLIRQLEPIVLRQFDALSKSDFGMAFYGIAAPAGTPRDIVESLQTEIAKYLRSPEIVKRLSDMAVVGTASTPDETTAIVKNNLGIFATITQKLGIQPQ